MVHRRLSVLCADYNGDLQSALAILEPQLLLLSQTCRAAVIQVIGNSWSASSRYNEKHIHNCTFGCGAGHPLPPEPERLDSLSHHLVCLLLWGIVADCPGLSVGSPPCTRGGSPWNGWTFACLPWPSTCITSYQKWAKVSDLPAEAATIAKVELFHPCYIAPTNKKYIYIYICMHVIL